MAKITAALERVARALKIQHALRAKAVRRMTARHKDQEHLEKQAAAARKAADELRAKAQPFLRFGATENQARGEALLRKAHRKDQKAVELDARVEKSKAKAIAWKQRARRKTQQTEKLSVSKAALDKKLEAMKPRVGKDGRVAGAKSLGEGFIWVNRYIASKCAGAERPNFYSMTAAGWNITHALLKKAQHAIGQLLGERSDCSEYGTEACWAAKLPDPNANNYEGGYTGSALAAAMAGTSGWKIVSEAEMRSKGWGIVIYLRWEGDTVGHHWENYIGEGGDGTIGHGSAPVDPGVIRLFGNDLYTCLIMEG